VNWSTGYNFTGFSVTDIAVSINGYVFSDEGNSSTTFVERSSDDGVTFSPFIAGIVESSCASLKMNPAGTKVYCTTSSAIYESADNPQGWNNISTPTLVGTISGSGTLGSSYVAFAPDGTLFVGNDNGELPLVDPATRVRRIAIGGTLIEDYGAEILADPDALAFDVTGRISGTAGSVLVGGLHSGFGTTSSIRAVLPNRQTITLFGPTTDFVNPNKLVIDHSDRLLMVDTYGVLSSRGGTPRRLFNYSPRSQTLAVGPDDRIYTTAYYDQTASGERWVVRIYSPDGTLNTVAFGEPLRLLLAVAGQRSCHG